MVVKKWSFGKGFRGIPHMRAGMTGVISVAPTFAKKLLGINEHV